MTANRSFTELMSIYSQSAQVHCPSSWMWLTNEVHRYRMLSHSQVLRQYASFMLNFLSDSTRGNEMLARADDIEQKRQMMATKGSARTGGLQHTLPLSLFDDDTGNPA